MASIPLGPFELQRPIGKGGMGEVWRGRHRDQDVVVAVKVMTAKVFEKEENRARFNNEVRAIAQLDHPGIVWVFDYGVVSAEAAAATGGRLVEGSPYLAMEHASGGTLSSLRRPLPWLELRAVLLSLLDALAHAHAHGIVHRDLKPANVLICGSRDMRPGVKLTDFGIASADVHDPSRSDEGHEPSRSDEVVGTLHYMSPEQIRGAAWHQGPHTDLYGLGCLAWRLACGSVPFTGRSGVQLLAAQLHKALPPIRPVLPVPQGFGDWIAALTAKDPADRLRRAADAAEVLLALGEDVPHRTPPPVLRTRGPSSLPPEPTRTDTRFLEEQVTVLALSRVKSGEARPEHHALADRRAPLPADWRREDPTRRSIRLLGAGLALFGVRAIPMVGRANERDALWSALREVHVERRARLVAIRGAAGTGKSRLAEWLTRRAHEVGGANMLMARYQETGPAEEPLRRMMLRGLNVRPDEPLTDEVLDGWVRMWRTQREGVQAALRTALGADPGKGLDRTTRHAMHRIAVTEMARERPLILWLDDVQWGLDGLLFAQSLLAGQDRRPTPVLVVVTVREEALVDREQEAAQLDALLADPSASELRLQPLSRPEQARLVQELLGLEPALGAAVEERAAGNPLFAVQLVGDWVQRGLLVPGEAGFELAVGESARLPDDLTEVWAERIERLLADLPRDARVVLERAAVIGPEVGSKEWRMVCDGDELVPRHEVIRRGLLERLLASRLARETDGGWVFAHGLLHETLLAGARASGRWQEHNRAAAWMLQGRATGQDAERIGLHLLEAGEHEAAIEPLLRGVAHRRVTVGRRSALRLIRQTEAAMEGRVPAPDRRWGALLLEKATTLSLMGSPEGEVVALELLDRARAHGWRELEGRAAYALGHHTRLAGDFEAARRWLTIAIARVRDERALAEVHHELGWLARKEIRIDEARRHEAAAAQLLRGLDDDEARAKSEWYQAAIAWHDNAWQRCETHARAGLGYAIDLGLRSQLWNVVAESARRQGDLAGAADALHEAIDIAEVIGQGNDAVLRANLALVHIADRSYEHADQVLHDALFGVRTASNPLLGAILHALLMTTSAGTASWAAFDDHARRAEELQADLPVGEQDCAEALETAAALCRDAGFEQRARRALLLSADHWKKLGNLTRHDELLARIP